MYTIFLRWVHGGLVQAKLGDEELFKLWKQLACLTVAGVDASSWDQIKSEVVVAGNMAKFGQNPKLKRILLGTGDRLLAAAASRTEFEASGTLPSKLGT